MPDTLVYKHGVTNTAAIEYNSVRCSSEQSPNLCGQIIHGIDTGAYSSG